MAPFLRHGVLAIAALRRERAEQEDNGEGHAIELQNRVLDAAGTDGYGTPTMEASDCVAAPRRGFYAVR
jgi:hypothetical protein